MGKLKHLRRALRRLVKTHALFLVKVEDVLFDSHFFSVEGKGYFCIRFFHGRSYWFDSRDIYLNSTDKRFYWDRKQFLWIRKSAINSKHGFCD